MGLIYQAFSKVVYQCLCWAKLKFKQNKNSAKFTKDSETRVESSRICLVNVAERFDSLIHSATLVVVFWCYQTSLSVNVLEKWCSKHWTLIVSLISTWKKAEVRNWIIEKVKLRRKENQNIWCTQVTGNLKFFFLAKSLTDQRILPDDKAGRHTGSWSLTHKPDLSLNHSVLPFQ